MIRYAILIPGDEMIGFIDYDGVPTLEMCADALAASAGFPDRDSFLLANPELNTIGFAPIH